MEILGYIKDKENMTKKGNKRRNLTRNLIIRPQAPT